ncbi:ATP-dependent helicase [Corynebacterium sp. TAE3-ERU12]|uniref:ATP-dependent helicase n=1 Tax=Corynebacterium sp. TAE3-ERU12 TaxID=2849491 RepID=UPI001C489270|nr:ATP-dependent helicase [Corynebacterium sp. TAE3-ERU12]MBV7295921.1 ATP-dependent helicase [Corynebacterium sp. TAE3-ERU12]
MADSVLDRFRPEVSAWFSDVFAQPTEVQQQAWSAISGGAHALVVAPTGSGKTLAAFLWALNSLCNPDDRRQSHGVRVLYISPLKALGADVENNLRAPLTGIAATAARLGAHHPQISVGVRSGDTTPRERSRQLKNPPDILITTPESLYLMLTSKAQSILTDVDTVIIDEIHALAGTKRGVHLALSLERLAHINTTGQTQRIGLSATVRPLDTVAQFLGGDREVTIIAPPAQKKWQLDVHVPVADMSDIAAAPSASTPAPDATVDEPGALPTSARPTQGSIWPFIEEQLYDEVMGAGSTLLFVNSRRTAERLTSRLNEIWATHHDPEALSPTTRRPPAQLMKATDIAGQATPVIARAHHGSVSKDERTDIEAQLKSGVLKCVVATSSLELGIDMGAVDLVIQVEAPPSVASGVQRVGRAGHTVGAVSRGSFYPKHRSDLVQTAVTVERMRTGQIEQLRVPKNALDVLVQQTIAATAAGDIHVDEWFSVVRRAYPYATLSRDVFDAVIDLAAGVYPSTDFAELTPRIVYDRVSGMLSARPGAQRVAVTSGGTIPDRGMFGVFLAGTGSEGSAPRRVGELDEEMVYESRVGDIFTLGASSWQIADITRDQVLVTPAPGHTGRLPFWSGDSVGRPAELGVALGALRREVAADPARLDGIGLDELARDNLVAFIADQAAATGVVPDERTLLVERFKDELGDWRIVLHSPYGRGVNAAWALAVGARISEHTGISAQPVAGDDGIVLRLPESATEPGAELFLFDADEIADVVAEQVGNSALFASRFRECAARALLLPRRNPGRRAPLWQQRQRSAQLLDVARQYPSFPVILETVRECLHDVYDLPALQQLCTQLRAHQVRIAEVTVESPSPFASSLLFSYTGAFMYEGDSPLAEKRAAALALDPALLAKLLGTVELRELIDGDVITQVHAQLQRTAPDRQARNAEELADVLRLIGPIPVGQVAQHCSFPDPVDTAVAQLGSRVMRVRFAGVEHVAAATDAAVLRDALGVPVPPGVVAAPEPVPDALGQLTHRFARTRGPFTVADLADSFGLATSVAHSAVRAAVGDKHLVEGHFRPGVEAVEYCAGDVLRMIRSRSLAQARAQAEPVSGAAFGRFLPQWHGIAPVGGRPQLRGADGTFIALEQLAGVRLPASAWESLILPSRVADYSPAFLDELTAAGDITVVGVGSAGARDPWIMLLPSDYAAQLVPEPLTDGLTELHHNLLAILERGGGFYFPELLADVGADAAAVAAALWDLTEAGLVSPDGFAPIRARLAGSSSAGAAHRAKRRPRRSRLRMGRSSFAQAHAGAGGGLGRPATPPDMVGRWSRTVRPTDEVTTRSVALGEAWLDRYGVVTRGSVQAEDVLGGFALAYKVLSEFEDTGRAMRGYIIDGLGAAQFSTPAVVDRLRAVADSPDLAGWPSGAAHPDVVVLAAADPANPYGAALAWPATPGTRCSRAAGALVVLIDGLLAAFITRGGRNVTVRDEELPATTRDVVAMVYTALATAVEHRRLSPVTVAKINGVAALSSPLAGDFQAAGAGITPKGVRIGSPGSARRA